MRLLLSVVALATAAHAQPTLPLLNTLEEAFLCSANPRVADRDGDGTDDLLTLRYIAGGSRVTVSYSSGRTGDTIQQILDVPDGWGGGCIEIGDVTGGGVPDLYTGDSNYDDLGRAFVFDGATGALLWDRPSPDPDLFNDFGIAAAPIGDATGDGRADLVVAEPDEGLHAFDGTTGALLWSATDLPGADIGRLALVPLGDVTDDGIGDVAASVAQGNGNANGVAVVSGADGALVHHLSSPNPIVNGDFGATLAPAGDRDGDGVGDLFVGAARETVDGVLFAGRVYLYSMATGVVLREYVFAPDVLAAGGRNFGSKLAGGADVDSDGVWDVATQVRVPAPAYTAVYLISGATGAVLARVQSPAPEAQGNFGGRMVLLGGPGGGRLVVGAAGETVGGEPNAGRIYVYGTVPVAGEVAPEAERAALAVAPNPFADGTTLSVSLAAPAVVRLDVLDVLGRTVATVLDGPLGAGTHAARLDGAALAPGVYAVRLTADGRTVTRTLVRTR